MEEIGAKNTVTRTNIPRIIFLGLLVLLATLAYWEVGVRVLAPAAFPLLRTDPEVGTIHVKNYDGMAWSARSQKYTHIKTNSLGYIGDEIAPDKPKGVIRIAVLGDSVVEGLEVNTSDTFPVLLQQKLNESGVCGTTQFEVMNFGVSGTGTFMQYQAFKKNIVPLKPDYVFLVFHDDYQDNLGKSQFDLDNFASERRAVGLKSFLLQFELPKFVFSKVQTNTFVLSALRYVGLFEGSAPAEISTASTTEIALEWPSYQYTFHVLDKLEDLVRDSHAKFIVIPYPNDPNSTDATAWHSDPHFSYLADFVNSKKIPWWDPSTYLAQQRAKSTPFTNGVDNHLIESGHKAFTEYLLAKLSQEFRNTTNCRPQ